LPHQKSEQKYGVKKYGVRSRKKYGVEKNMKKICEKNMHKKYGVTHKKYGVRSSIVSFPGKIWGQV
jgi:hypothetical protein